MGEAGGKLLPQTAQFPPPPFSSQKIVSDILFYHKQVIFCNVTIQLSSQNAALYQTGSYFKLSQVSKINAFLHVLPLPLLPPTYYALSMTASP